jgi:hypothetical protein
MSKVLPLLSAVYSGLKKIGKLKKWFISFKTLPKGEWAITCPVLDSSSLVPVPMLKHQNPILDTYKRDRDKVCYKCTMYYTVQFIITLFDVVNILQCTIYQLNFNIFVYITWISHYTVYSIRYYPRFQTTMEHITHRYGGTTVHKLILVIQYIILGFS